MGHGLTPAQCVGLMHAMCNDLVTYYTTKERGTLVNNVLGGQNPPVNNVRGD